MLKNTKSWSTPAHRKSVHAAVFLLCFTTAGLARADFVANFDSLPAAGLPSGLSGAPVTNYLATFGITLSDVTPGTALTVYDSRDVGGVVIPPSPFNFIAQAGSDDPISYTLNFALSQDHFSMTRVGLHPITGLALPEWHAYAYDASGNLLGTVGESAFGIYSDIPAETFTLDGPNIRSVRIDSNNGHFAAFGSVLLDDFTLTSVPEPSSTTLMALGLAGLAVHAGWRGREKLKKWGLNENLKL